MAQIQWFPGHMAKAKREIAEKIKLIDIVVELVDARAPYSSKNPLFNGIVNNKPRLIVMTKEDLANPEITKKWIQYYKDHGYYAMSVNLKQFNELRPHALRNRRRSRASFPAGTRLRHHRP